jgi:Dolichyl-phosphate-mannose-protein mannosyltransferase
VLAVVSATARFVVWRPHVAGRRALDLVAGLPTVVSLTLLVGLAASFRIVLGLAETTPRVLGDELIYADLAKSFAVHGEPLLRGELHLGHSVLYPLFASPAYAIAADGVAAFGAVKVVNAVAMALTAVPAYLLGRKVLSHAWSLAVAALAVAAPWLVYTALMLTEPLFSVLVTAFALALVRMLERPTWLRQAVVVLGLAVLIGVRAQAIALVVSLLLALLLDGWLRRSLARTAETYAFLLLALGLAFTAVAFAAAAGVSLPQDAYASLLDRAYSIPSVVKWAWWNVAVYELGLGVIALAAFPLGLAGLLRREASDAERSVGIAALSMFVGVLLSVALLSASPFGLDRLHERSLFYVTPLVLICFARWLAEGLPRPRLLAGLGALGVVAAAVSLPSRVVVDTGAVDSPTSAFLAQLDGTWPGGSDRLWTTVLALAGAAAFLLARRPFVPLVGVALAFLAVTASSDLQGELPAGRERALAWVDRALPDGSTAALVHVAFPLGPSEPCASDVRDQQEQFVVWTEFANTRIDRVAHVYGPVGRDGIDSQELQVAADGTLVGKDGPYRASYVVVDSRQPIAGTELARFDEASLGDAYSGSLTLWNADPPVRFAPRPARVPPRADGRDC